MRDWIFKPNRRSRLVDWWAVDAWIDSSIYGAWARYKDWWAAYSNFFGRFRVTGFRKFITEIFSEAATLGTLGLAGLLAFAVPAIQETNNSVWRTASQYSVTVLDRNDKEIGKRGILHSDAVPLEELPDHLIKATLATEDRRFFEHFGIDFLGTARALSANVRASDVVQGGSSVTQQLAKNLFLSSERSFDRKIKEAFIALWLEARLTKKEILKLYLDRSYLGGGTFGVEAASQFYFGKSVRDITLAEAALLAGLFKAPTKYAPHANQAESLARANQVLTNMVEAGFMTEGQVYGARINPAKVIERTIHDSPNYFLDWAFEEVQRLMKGKGEYLLTVRTTIDPQMQKAAEQAVETTLNQNGRSYRFDQAALVGMETDGAVRAMVGGGDYGESQFNRAAHANRQPGSSFKPYVYITALENGYRPNSMVVDAPVSCGNHSIGNYEGGYQGRMTLTTALAKSRNTIAAKLSFDPKVTRDRVLIILKKLGINIQKTCTMALGDQGITPLAHTAAHAVFANGGKAVRPYAIIEMRNSRDDVVYARERDEPPPKQIIERKYVEMLNQMLRAVVTEGTGRAAELEFTYSAGKTGTSSDYRDAWFIGFTGQLVAGVWLGNDNFSPMANVTGGKLAAPVWQQFMAAAHGSYQTIPSIPGLGSHPRQQEDADRIAEFKKEDPAPSTPAAQAAPQTVHHRMPPKTRKLMSSINKIFKDAKKIEEAASQPDGRGAALAPPPSQRWR